MILFPWIKFVLWKLNLQPFFLNGGSCMIFAVVRWGITTSCCKTSASRVTSLIKTMSLVTGPFFRPTTGSLRKIGLVHHVHFVTKSKTSNILRHLTRSVFQKTGSGRTENRNRSFWARCCSLSPSHSAEPTEKLPDNSNLPRVFLCIKHKSKILIVTWKLYNQSFLIKLMCHFIFYYNLSCHPSGYNWIDNKLMYTTL